MGTSEFAAEILEALIGIEYDIISVYTQPDKKVGRNQELKKSAVKAAAEKGKIKIFQPVKFDAEEIEKLRDQKPDLIIVAAYGKIIPKSILEIPGFGALNIHGSFLPKYRGPSPVQNALLLGEKKTGTTIMLMDEGIDTGDILAQKEIDIYKEEAAPELLKRLAKISSELLIKTLPFWISRKIVPQKQDHAKATLCQLIEKTDGKIFWTDSAEDIYNRYRAFQPWPGIFTFWKGKNGMRRIRLNKINLIKTDPETKHHIGEVFQFGEKIGVQTTLGVIILEEIQLEGKSSTKIGEFVNGYLDFLGSVLK